ncbi:hypothetical protein [Chitinophaga nivalis]|uniref:Uncharacterized protein n=1 Tax=Chitinophaga nivalis TaxID=2991709 RepID=A0ABT3IJM1_9BACT|nr:hypothetical protein [Chitinophaga nivalis]MCW3466193.1 hypothetical protein [Chitinophaga nivalis]MCW3484116.1 hypothetical protein [Chitinophaga nivalis]
MRSLNLKQLKSFFTFDLPVKYSYIYSRFRKTHERKRDIYASWPAEATRHQLINEYWNNALWHYLLLVVVATAAVWFYNDQLNGMYMIICVTVGIIVYLPLYFLLYRPVFTGDFLPKLETVIAVYEGRERAWLEKCKQDQLTNRALVLFFYAFDKASKANYLTPSDKCADLLHKIFGSDPGGIKKALDLIYKKDKRAKLEHRHLVEVGKSFEEAYVILETMQFDEGIQRLKQLEQQFQRP